MKIKLTEPFWNGSKWIPAGTEIEVTSALAKELLLFRICELIEPERKPVKEFKRAAAYEEE